MSLVKWNKEGDLFSTIPSFFDEFMGRDFMSGIQTGTSMPAVNIAETDTAFDIAVAAPGLKKEDFKINLENNVLSIACEKKEEKETTEKKVTRKEFSFSSFKRAFTLPETVAEDKIDATYKDGVLNIHIPKKEEAKKQPAKLIEIK